MRLFHGVPVDRTHCFQRGDLGSIPDPGNKMLKAAWPGKNSMWNEHNCTIVWTCFGIGMKTDLFQSCGHCWVFWIWWHAECSTFTASSLGNRNSSAGIPSPPLALFIVILPKAHLTSHSRMSDSCEWPHHHGYPGHQDLFCMDFLCILVTSS